MNNPLDGGEVSQAGNNKAGTQVTEVLDQPFHSRSFLNQKCTPKSAFERTDINKYFIVCHLNATYIFLIPAPQTGTR